MTYRNGPAGKREERSLEGFVKIAPLVTGLAASFLTAPVEHWLVPLPWNREQLGRPVAITVVCIGLFLEFAMLIAKSKANNASTRKLFLLMSIAVYFGSVAGGQIAQILWTLKWG